MTGILLTVLLGLMAPPTPVPADGWSQYAEPPPRPPIVERLVQCESGDDPTAKNRRSTASGTFQFLDGTWEWVTGSPPPARAYPLWRQREAFDRLWDDGAGSSHWQPSRHCWA